MQHSNLKEIIYLSIYLCKEVWKSDHGGRHVRWWFWLEGEESVLKLADGVSFGRLNRDRLFLESVVI
jgi:hypothetical protein